MLYSINDFEDVIDINITDIETINGLIKDFKIQYPFNSNVDDFVNFLISRGYSVKRVVLGIIDLNE